MEYSNLSKFEKFEEFKEVNFCRNERTVAAKYLRSIWLNDVSVMNDFERFGNTPSKIIYNYRQYQQNLKFGFENIIIDEHGWLERPQLLDREKIIIFKLKDSYINMNNISIGRGVKENTWTFGFDIQNSTSGYHSGACVWGKIVSTKELAIEMACLKIIEFHEKNESVISKKVINLAKEKIEEIKGQKLVQLCFSF